MAKVDPKSNIERINAVRRRAVTLPQRTPHLSRCPVCGQALRALLSHPDPPPTTIVLDALESTVSACPKDRLLWIHERGGIAGVESWLGPVPAQENEREPPANIPPSPPGRNR